VLALINTRGLAWKYTICKTLRTQNLTKLGPLGVFLRPGEIALHSDKMEPSNHLLTNKL